MKAGIAIGFVIGFFVGPIYFSHVYPFLYHLILPVPTDATINIPGVIISWGAPNVGLVGHRCSLDGTNWFPARNDGVCYIEDSPGAPIDH